LQSKKKRELNPKKTSKKFSFKKNFIDKILIINNKKNFFKKIAKIFFQTKNLLYICEEILVQVMTEDKEILINEFREKFRQLMTVCDRLNEENSALKAKNAELNKDISRMEGEYKELNLKVENLKTVISLVSDSDKHAAKIKLNRMAREVDRILALLTD
jgi:predicted nuclease with TOPRIM domain